MDWSAVALNALKIRYYWSPQAGGKRKDDGILTYTIDIGQMMMAPRLESFELHCKYLRLHNYSTITRQDLEDKKLKIILGSEKEFKRKDAAWLKSVGLVIEHEKYSGWTAKNVFDTQSSEA